MEKLTDTISVIKTKLSSTPIKVSGIVINRTLSSQLQLRLQSLQINELNNEVPGVKVHVGSEGQGIQRDGLNQDHLIIIRIRKMVKFCVQTNFIFRKKTYFSHCKNDLGSGWYFSYCRILVKQCFHPPPQDKNNVLMTNNIIFQQISAFPTLLFQGNTDMNI